MADIRDLIVSAVMVTIVMCALLPSALSRELNDMDRLQRLRRVIGGEEVMEGEWPWLASLQGKIPTRFLWGIPISYRKFYCGASLIDEQWVLTAAHCFLENDIDPSLSLTPKYWHVRLGDTELDTTLKEDIMGVIGDVLDFDEWRVWYPHASRIVIHPQYDRSDDWHNDIALVKLDEPVPASEDELPEIQNVFLPDQGETEFPEALQECVMKGWGCTEGGGSVSEHARATTLAIVPDDKCADFWHVTTDTRLCAGYNLEARGICSGDSGGPLVCDRNGSWIQTGIASFTSSSRPGNVPGAFTRVSAYVDWIVDTIVQDRIDSYE